MTVTDPIVCTPRSLPFGARAAAALAAAEVNPVNRPPQHHIDGLAGDASVRRAAIAALTTKYWHGAGGVRLPVGFLDRPAAELRRRILEHMNAWGTTANVRFTQSRTEAAVRIAREGGPDGGYWSYLGTDILQIDADQPTMNLEAFTMRTPEAEFHRVVRHETGHTLGFPHEHMRAALVARIDRDKAIAHFELTQGWSAAETIAQVLTPIEEVALIGTRADPRSIMCYQLPGSIMKDGKPLVGGKDIDALDHAFAAQLYPRSARRYHRRVPIPAPSPTA
jgi:hypothetical protein